MSSRIALLIANRHSEDPALRGLAAPKADSRSLGALLEKGAVGGFDRVEQAADLPAEALRASIRALFFFKKPHDLVLFYYSGLILADEDGRLYLATADTRLDDLAATAVSLAYLNQQMDLSFARQQIVLFDCHLAGRATGAGARAEVDMAAAMRGKGSWRRVLASTGRTPTVWLAPGGRWQRVARPFPLTAALAQGLGTGQADLNGDLLVGMDDVEAYLVEQARRRRWERTPDVWRYRERGDFVLARKPDGDARPRRLKWNLVLGGVLAPAATVLIGGHSDLMGALLMALFFSMLYSLLYRVLD